MRLGRNVVDACSSALASRHQPGDIYAVVKPSQPTTDVDPPVIEQLPPTTMTPKYSPNPSITHSPARSIRSDTTAHPPPAVRLSSPLTDPLPPPDLPRSPVSTIPCHGAAIDRPEAEREPPTTARLDKPASARPRRMMISRSAQTPPEEPTVRLWPHPKTPKNILIGFNDGS